MNMLKCLLTENDCYKKYHTAGLAPVGIVVHSTDPAGRVLSRFVQPAQGQTMGLELDGAAATAEQLLAALGKNRYGNHWNRSGVQACVHAFVGELANGSLAVCQTLDWTQPCWGAGSGKNGSYNGCLNGKAAEPLYIQFEMIESSAAELGYCGRVYALAAELCAELMRRFPTIRLENIVSHKEAHGRGCATDHGDPESWWKRCGMGVTMADFRADVASLRNGDCAVTKNELAAQLAAQQALYEERLLRELDRTLGCYIDHAQDIPHSSVRTQIRQLLDCGAIDGGTSCDRDPDDIRLPYSIVRALVMMKRYVDGRLAGGGA